MLSLTSLTRRTLCTGRVNPCLPALGDPLPPSTGGQKDLLICETEDPCAGDGAKLDAMLRMDVSPSGRLRRRQYLDASTLCFPSLSAVEDSSFPPVAILTDSSRRWKFPVRGGRLRGLPYSARRSRGGRPSAVSPSGALERASVYKGWSLSRVVSGTIGPDPIMSHSFVSVPGCRCRARILHRDAIVPIML